MAVQVTSLLPIKCRKLHKGDYGQVGFWQATFLKDWGPWKEGQKFWHVWIDALKGVIWTESRDNNEWPPVKGPEVAFEIRRKLK